MIFFVCQGGKFQNFPTNILQSGIPLVAGQSNNQLHYFERLILKNPPTTFTIKKAESTITRPTTA